MTDRAVLIIGASSGMGMATALRLAAAGDRLVLVARDEDALVAAEKACREAGGSDVRIVVADASTAVGVRRAVDAVLDAHGRLDAVVHTATVMAYGTLENLPQDVFTTVVDTAVHGTFHLAQEVLPVLRRQRHGTVIVVNSLLGSVTVPNMGAYATAKWGQRAVVRTMQQEVRGVRGVRVCLVSPGSINTPIYYQAANHMSRDARPPIPVLQPERAAKVVAGLIDKPRQHVSVPVGPGNPLVIFGYRFLPFVYDRVVGTLFRVAAQTSRRSGVTDGNVLAPKPDQDRVRGHWPAPR